MQEEKVWWVETGGRRYGPYSAREMKMLAALERLAATDMIRKEGMRNWVTASSLGLGLPQPAPVPAPPAPAARERDRQPGRAAAAPVPTASSGQAARKPVRQYVLLACLIVVAAGAWVTAGPGFDWGIGGAPAPSAPSRPSPRKADPSRTAPSASAQPGVYLSTCPMPREKFAELLKQAEQGHAPSQTEMGDLHGQEMVAFRKGTERLEEELYSAGQIAPERTSGKLSCVKQDVQQALAWYRKAAERGYAPAQFYLGYAYFFGAGANLDEKQGVEWLRKAAEQGQPRAQVFLAGAYQLGQGGLRQDYQQAAAWYRKAAERGSKGAQSSLSLLHYTGQGVPRDLVQAYKWHLLVWSVNPPEHQSKIRHDMEAKMTPEQLREARELAKAWKPVSGG